MMTGRSRAPRLSAWIALAMLGAAAPNAHAQAFYEGPYPYPYAYGGYRDLPDYGPGPQAGPPIRRRVAALLAEEGFSLNGPLQRAAGVVIAFGTDSAGRSARFVIDPVYGEVLEKHPLRPQTAGLWDGPGRGAAPGWSPGREAGPPPPREPRDPLSQAAPPATQGFEHSPVAPSASKPAAPEPPKPPPGRLSSLKPATAAPPAPPRPPAQQAAAPATKASPVAKASPAPTGSAHRAITPPPVAAPAAAPPPRAPALAAPEPSKPPLARPSLLAPVPTAAPAQPATPPPVATVSSASGSAPPRVTAGPPSNIPPTVQSYQGLPQPHAAEGAQKPGGG